MNKLNLEMVIEISVNGKKVISNEKGNLVKIDNTEDKENGFTIQYNL